MKTEIKLYLSVVNKAIAKQSTAHIMATRNVIKLYFSRFVGHTFVGLEAAAWLHGCEA